MSGDDFYVNTDLFPRTTFDALVLLTDLEPDDLVAIYLIMRRLSRTVPVLVVVGEGRATKTTMAYNLMRALGHEVFSVVQSTQSAKAYPITMLSAFGDQIPPPSVVLSIDAGLAIERILRRTTNPLIVALKPFPELLQPQFPRDLLRKTKLALYGSFNLRNTIVGTEDGGTKDVYEFLNTSFKDVVLYESFLAAGEKNSLEKTTFPAFFEKASKIAANPAKSSRLFWQGFFTSVDAWNESLLNEQLEKVQRKAAAVSSAFANPATTKQERLTAVAEVERNMKIIGNITAADSQQLVIADIGVGAILAVDPGEFLKPGNIQKSLLQKGPKGTVAVPNELYGTVKVIVGIKLEEMIRDVVALIN